MSYEYPANTVVLIYIYFFLPALQPPSEVVFYSHLVGFSLLAYEVSWSHTTRQSVGLLWTNDQSVAETSTWQHTTNIHAPGGIWTHNLSRQAAKDLRLTPRGHWNRHLFLHEVVFCITIIIIIIIIIIITATKYHLMTNSKYENHFSAQLPSLVPQNKGSRFC